MIQTICLKLCIFHPNWLLRFLVMVIVTQKYDGVLRQLTYHKKQFVYHQNVTKLSQWYLKPDEYYIKYILMKNSINRV